jgi:hypothetical protein
LDDPKLRAFPGTNKLGRPLTDDEKRDLAALLRAHDYVSCRIRALAFAFRLRHERDAANDLAGRADHRFVRVGWDPRLVTLVKRLCRLVWSEHTHEKEESVTAREAEEIFLAETEAPAAHDRFGKPLPPIDASPEDRAVEVQESFDARTHATTQLDRLRAVFEQKGDAVNLLWLDYSLQEITDLGRMADLSGRDVSEFYAAAKRRQAVVTKILAASRGPKQDT